MTTRTISKSLAFIGIFFIFCFINTAQSVFAVEFKPLVGIPGLTDSGQMSLPQYVNTVYLLLIGLGSLFGVFKIAEAAVKYSLSDIAPVKADLRKEIQNILLGLAVLLLPYLVLNEINPNLTNLNMLQNVTKISLPSISQKEKTGEVTTKPTDTTTQKDGETIATCIASGENNCEQTQGTQTSGETVATCTASGESNCEGTAANTNEETFESATSCSEKGGTWGMSSETGAFACSFN